MSKCSYSRLLRVSESNGVLESSEESVLRFGSSRRISRTPALLTEHEAPSTSLAVRRHVARQMMLSRNEDNDLCIVGNGRKAHCTDVSYYLTSNLFHFSSHLLSFLFTQIQSLAFSTVSWSSFIAAIFWRAFKPIVENHCFNWLPTNPRQPTSIER